MLADRTVLNLMYAQSVPVTHAAAVTPADGADLPNAATRGLYVGVTGDIKVDLVDAGTAVLFKAVPAGFFAVQAKRVYAAGTTATSIVALW